MSIQEDLAVAYHQQDTDYYCGAACAQMVLDECGVGLLDQDTLYTHNHSHSLVESGWFTAPDGLQWTLNNLQNGRYFALDALSSENALSRMLVWTIHHYKIAPIALVYGWQHWIVVRGYTATSAPATSTDTSYAIESFDVNNPWPPVPGFYNQALKPPPSHSASDDCGTGGTRGIADENISYSTWQSTYMTGVPDGFWKGKFVAVCDPDQPPRAGGPMSAPITSAPHILPAERAAQDAINALQTRGLAARRAWAGALDKATPHEPVLVQRLDRPGSFYYIVPVGADPNSMTVAVSVDAFSGAYRQSARFHRAAPTIKRIQVAEVSQQFSGHRFEIGPDRGFLTLHPGTISVHPTWVWKPCRESLSPHYPFKLIQSGAHSLYERSDGHIFTTLNDNHAGL